MSELPSVGPTGGGLEGPLFMYAYSGPDMGVYKV